MVVVTASVTARPDSIDALRRASLAPVRRSQAEGCLLHWVQVDCENPLRLSFHEEWRDLAALWSTASSPDRVRFWRRCGILRRRASRSRCMRQRRSR